MKTINKAVSLFLLFVFPLSVVAANTGAMAIPNGNVSLNGTAFSQPTAVFSGDRIATSNGSASLAISGTTVQVAPQSAVVYKQNSVEIASGGAQVVTKSGMGAHIMNLSVAPSNDAKYSVGVRDGKVLVAALEGNLTLIDGHQQRMLTAGSAFSLPVQDQSTDNNKKSKKCKKDDQACKDAAAAAGAGAGAGAAAGGATAAGVSLSTAAMVGVVAATAAVSAGLSYGITKATEPSSGQ